MILAAVTVRCPSNGRRASSTSGLLAPAAQTSTGHAAYSCLPCPAVCHCWPCHPSILTHTSCYSPATAASHRSRSSQPTYSPSRGHPLPCLPRLHVIPFLGLAIVHRL